MKKIIFIIILIFSICKQIHAQDTIYFTNGSIWIVKLEMINTQKIHFKRFDNLSGPQYIYPKSEIHKIIYKDGFTEAYTPIKKISQDTISNIYFNKYKNSVGFNTLNLLFAQAYIFGERKLHNNFSIRFPFSMGFSHTYFSDFLLNSNKYSKSNFKVGLELMNYFNPKQELYVGLSTRYGVHEIKERVYNLGSYYITRYFKNSITFTTIAGVQANITPRFSILLQSGLGCIWYQNGIVVNGIKYYFFPHIQFGIMPVLKF
ncbi:MAG: hypothetical protein ACK4IK_06720 [Bacteroidia bacterium]